MSYHKLSQSYASFVSQLSSISIPSNIQEALADPRWTEAMVDEMTTLEKNNTWNLESNHMSLFTQQSGVAERKNRHILEVTRSLLIDDNVPSHLWGEAVSSAVYLIN